MRRSVISALLLALALASAARAAFREQSKIEAAYRHALGAWAEGDDEGALAQLLRIDQAGTVGREADRVARAKLAVAKAMGRRDPAAVLAAAALESRAYLAYATHRPTLAAEARHSVAALVDLHVSLDKKRTGRPLDTAMLASLAGEAASRAQLTAATELYTRVLALVPGQPAAVLGLAAIHELHSRYAEAAELLRPLVEAHPEAREARLRLAVNELRLGRRKHAEGELRALAGSGVDWVRSLAAQELARLLAGRGDLAGAAATLEAAAALLPCDPSLPVQASLVSERAGHATPLDLSTLGACGEAAESARARYTHPPSSELVALRKDIGAADAEWRRALAAVLSSGARTRATE